MKGHVAKDHVHLLIRRQRRKDQPTDGVAERA